MTLKKTIRGLEEVLRKWRIASCANVLGETMKVKQYFYDAGILIAEMFYTLSLEPFKKYLKNRWETKYYKAKGYNKSADEF